MADYAIHCPKLPWMIDFFSTDDGKIPDNQFPAAYAQNALEYQTNLSFQSRPTKKRLTGIICTLGAKSIEVPLLMDMIKAGMCAARLKQPFFSTTECQAAVKNIKIACDDYSLKMGTVFPIAITMELRGPEIRTGLLKDSKTGSMQLKEGKEVYITADPAYEEHVTPDMIYVDYAKINEVTEPGDKFFIDNNVTLSALEIVGSIIKCIIERAGSIGDRASVRMDSSVLELPSISEVQVQEAIDLGVDAVFVSSVKDKEVILQVKKYMGEEGKSIMIIANIDSELGVKNIERILEVADGILISRSHLSADIPLRKLFLVQKRIIALCNKAGKPVIVAPQMLSSMFMNSSPANSEVMDVANAVLDGADCIMLSRETSSGKYVLEAIQQLSKICREAEAAVHQRDMFQNLSAVYHFPFEPIYSLAIGAVEASMKSSAAAIILLTVSGRTAKVISQYRPRCPIIAVTRYARVAKNLKMFRAVEPLQFIKKPLKDYPKDVNRRLQFGITYGKLCGFIRAGDSIITITGSRAGTGFTNCMHMYYASDFDTVDNADLFL